MPRTKKPVEVVTPAPVVAAPAEKPKRTRKPRVSADSAAPPVVQEKPKRQRQPAIPAVKQEVVLNPPPALPLKEKRVRKNQPQKGQSAWHKFAKEKYTAAKAKDSTLLYKNFLKAGEAAKEWKALKMAKASA